MFRLIILVQLFIFMYFQGKDILIPRSSNTDVLGRQLEEDTKRERQYSKTGDKNQQSTVSLLC